MLKNESTYHSAIYKKTHIWSFFILFFTLGIISWISSFQIAPVVSGHLVL